MTSFKVRLSKFLSYVLRHDPYKYGLHPDAEGFVAIAEVLETLKKRFRKFRDDELFELIENDPKERFEIRGKKIRAAYGHSIEAMPGEESIESPPEVLFHGTSAEAAERILLGGLKAMGRKFVHLSINEDDAYMVGSRHAKEPVILKILAAEAERHGVTFYRKGRVFLAGSIPKEFIIRRGDI